MSDDPFFERPRVGSLLRYFRERAGLSQADLDYHSGVDESSITDIETGKVNRPQNGTLERLALGLAGQMTS